MRFDRYKHRLQHAAWTWRECKICSWHSKPRNKDRESGRADKRGAKAEDKREIEKDKQGDE